MANSRTEIPAAEDETSTALVIAAPDTVAVAAGLADFVSGVSIAEAGASDSEAFTVTLSDKDGSLNDTGAVDNNGTLTITGTLDEVNYVLASLTDSVAAGGADTITIDASDSLGDVAAPATVAVTVNGPLELSAPGSITVPAGQTTPIGVSLSETGDTSNEVFAVTLENLYGQLSVASISGVTVYGSGNALSFEGTLDQVNAELATLTDNVSSSPTDYLTVIAADSLGQAAPTAIINLTVSGLILSAPPNTTAEQGSAAPIELVSIAENGSKPDEMFTVTLSDNAGLLSALGAGISGVGTKELTVSGTLTQVNTDLATLTVQEPTTAPDTITVRASDSLGGTAIPRSIAVAVNGPLTINAPTSVTVTARQPGAIAGISLAESGTTTNEIFVVEVSAASGDLNVPASTLSVTGNGTEGLFLIGSLTDINSALSGLTDTEAGPGSDTIDISVTDSLGASDREQIAVTATGALVPVITAPTSAVVNVGLATPIAIEAGALVPVTLSEPGAATTETFTVTVSDNAGLLAANGLPGVSGAGSTKLSITGSLDQVNQDLGALTDDEPTTAPDTIDFTASDSLGNAAAGVSIAVTVNGQLAITAPTAAVVTASQATAISGVSLSESGDVTDETFFAYVSDSSGVLSVTAGPTGGVSDNDSSEVDIFGSLSQVNAILATLTDTEATATSDTIVVDASDTLGSTAAEQQIAVSVSGALPPVISAPLAATVAQGQATQVGPISVAESGGTPDETFAVTLGAAGVLSATGTGVSGSGTTTLTISGSLTEVNADLATVEDTEQAAGTDTLTVSATDSLGGVATPVTVQITSVPVLSGALALTTASEGALIASPTAVARFTDTDAAATASDFTAMINWSDGTSSTGIVAGSDGSFVVTPDAAGHAYQSLGSVPLAVTVSGPLGSGIRIAGTVAVTDALSEISAPGFVALGGEQFSGTIATFHDSFAGNNSGDFSAVINWGDGSTPAAGVVTYNNGTISVTGAHTFAKTQGETDTVTVALSDIGNASASATAKATIVPATDEPMLAASSGYLISEGDNRYVLDLGTVAQGDTPDLVALSIENQGAAALSGDFALGAATGILSGGFDPVSDLAAGANAVAGYAVVDPSTPGQSSEEVTVTPTLSGTGALPPETILVEADVTPPPLPPVPSTAPDLPVPTPTTAANSLGDATIFPTTVTFGDVPLGSEAEQAITVTNNAKPPGNELDASVGDVTGDATGSGSVDDLAPSRSNSDGIQVGIDTSSLGEKFGTVTIDVDSNGSGPVDVVDVPLDFKTTNQNVSALGGSAVLSSASIAGTVTVGAPPFSVTASGSASNVLSASASLDPGTVSVNYPVQAGAELPVGFQPGQSFTVDTGELGYGNLSLNTQTANLASASLTDAINVSLGGNAVLPSTTIPFNYGLAAALGIGVGVGFPNPSDVSLGPLSLELPGPISTGTMLPGATATDLPSLVSKGNSGSFLKVTGDILQGLALLFPELKGLDVDLPDELGKIELLAENVSIGLALAEEFIFHPTGIDVSISPNYDPSAIETGELGDSFTFDPPANWDQPVVLTTNYSMVGTLEEQTSLVAQVSGELEGGVLKIEAGKFLGIPIDIDVGPVFKYNLGEVEIGDGLKLSQSDDALGGFNPVQQKYTIPVSQSSGQSGPEDLPSQTVVVTGNVVAPTATIDGCPHFTTFDGLHFDFQGAGEFIAARSTQSGDSFQVQMRIEPEFGPDSAVSIITQIAVQVGRDRVTFAANRSDVVWVDGAAASISQSNPVLQLSGGSVTEISSYNYRIALSTGEVVTVNPFGDGMGLSIALASNDGPGSVQGFLGADEGQANDFQLPDGTVLQQPLTQTQLYQTFANAWRVTDADLLLDYGSGQDTATFTSTQYPREVLTLADLPADLVAKASALAAAAGITDPTVAADAEFDYITMGDPSFFTEDAAVAGQDASPPTPAVITQPVATPPSVGAAPADPTVTETTGATTPVTFVVNLTSPASADTVVDYTAVTPTGDMSGKQFLSATDFGGALPSGQVTIAAGQTETNVTINVPNSALGSAASKWLMVNVTSPSGALVYDAEGQVELLNSQPTAGALAQPAIELLSGPTSSGVVPALTANGNDYTLDLGALRQGSTSGPIQFAVVNAASAGSDSLRGEVSLVMGSGFTVSGTQLPSTIAAGDAYQDLYFQPDTTKSGTHSETITITSDDVNDTGYAGSLPDLTLTVTGTILCFVAGTQIATPAGEVSVEQLTVGDLVRTLRDEMRRIVWIGVGRVLSTRFRRTAATPVIVRKGALADNVPYADLRITKAHALYLDDVLIPAEFLVNHKTILWDDRAQEVQLYHIELESHDVLLANGAPAESYRDDGNRWLFQNANSGWGLPPQEPCAPVLTGGPIVDAVWRRLLDRAGRCTGVPLTDDPDLHLMADSRRVEATERAGLVHVFRLPTAPSILRIVSRAAIPAELGLARDDRSLGVAVRSIILRRGTRFRTIEADDHRLTKGFHGYEPQEGIRWTNGDAMLSRDVFAGFTGPMECVVHVTMVGRYVDEGKIRRTA